MRDRLFRGGIAAGLLAGGRGRADGDGLKDHGPRCACQGRRIGWVLPDDRLEEAKERSRFLGRVEVEVTTT